MASTRSKNTPGNYSNEQSAFTKYVQYNTIHESVGEVYHPGNGLMGLKCPSHVLSMNAPDVESALFGIGSTNLVQPNTPTVPSFTPLKHLSIVDRPILIMPKPLVLDTNARPQFR